MDNRGSSVNWGLIGGVILSGLVWVFLAWLIF
jgi:hypothetical protein